MRLRSFSENAHNSYTASYILIKFCIDIHWYENSDKALLRVSLAGGGQMHITLEPHDIFSLYFACLDTDMQNNDEALLSISLFCHGLLLQMLIALEPHGKIS